jgi:hypothetical protein
MAPLSNHNHEEVQSERPTGSAVPVLLISKPGEYLGTSSYVILT